MSSQHPLSSDAIKGITTRHGQLEAWAEHAKKRLDELSRTAPRFDTPGAQALFRTGYGYLRDVVTRLDKLRPRLAFLKSLKAGVSCALTTVLGELQSVESLIRAVDQRILPVLSSRTPSDPQYDDFSKKFLAHIGLADFSPVTSHKQHDVQGLACDSFLNHPIFFFSPSIRSLDALSLLYHEIGHVFHRRVLVENKQLQRDLMRHMLPMAPEWTTYSKQKTTEDVALAEIEATFPSLWRRAGEITADAFAGIVGGHSYTSSLCNMFLSKSSIRRWTNSQHPPAVWRVWFSRRASIIGGSDPKKDNVGPSFSAWETVEALSAPDGTTSGLVGPSPPDSELAQDDNVIDEFLGYFRDMLTRLKILVAGETKAEYVEPPGGQPPDLDWDKAKVPTMLLAASKYREASGWSDYCPWERSIFSKIVSAK